MAEPQSPEQQFPDTHKTIVLGWDKNGKLQYMRTFNFKFEREGALKAYDYCSKNFDAYVISDITVVNIKPDEPDNPEEGDFGD